MSWWEAEPVFKLRLSRTITLKADGSTMAANQAGRWQDETVI